MGRQYREPGAARVVDRFHKLDGSATQLKLQLEEAGRNLREYKRWRTRWVDLDGRQKTKDFARKADAQRFADETNAAILRHEYIDARQGRTTVLEIYEEWEPTTSVSDKTRYTRKSTWKNHLLDKWGDRPVSTIKDVEVQAWVAEEFRSGTSRAVLQQALALFRLLLGYAVKTGRTMTNAASGVKLPPKQPSDRCF